MNVAGLKFMFVFAAICASCFLHAKWHVRPHHSALIPQPAFPAAVLCTPRYRCLISVHVNARSHLIGRFYDLRVTVELNSVTVTVTPSYDKLCGSLLQSQSLTLIIDDFRAGFRNICRCHQRITLTRAITQNLPMAVL